MNKTNLKLPANWLPIIELHRDGETHFEEPKWINLDRLYEIKMKPNSDLYTAALQDRSFITFRLIKEET
jgi:hypothetical protein